MEFSSPFHPWMRSRHRAGSAWFERRRKVQFPNVLNSGSISVGTFSNPIQYNENEYYQRDRNQSRKDTKETRQRSVLPENDVDKAITNDEQ
jgi:hypothetical protein